MKLKPSHRRSILLPVLMSTLVLLGGCDRKKRLTENHFNFAITPPAATVVKGTPITMTASTGGSGEVSPTWEVAPTSAGTFNPAVGQTVSFTPTVLGDAVVLATYDGLQAQSQLAVVTYIPSSNTFDVYTDELIPNDPQLSAGLLLFVGGGVTLSESSDGYTPQGLQYFRGTGPTNGFWGITLDQFNTGASKDLSAFSLGTLRFALRIPAGLGATQNLRIDIRDSTNTRSVTLDDTHGLNRISTDWQEISIPVSAFGGPPLDLSDMENVFAIVLLNITTSLTFDVDAIRWEK